jgi:hypothetical protein
MSNGAFRDASAAIERAMMLEQENEQLRNQVADFAKLRIEAEEVEALRAQVEQLRGLARSENEGAYLKRVIEERDELALEVRTLRDRLATQERALTRLRLELRQRVANGLFEPLVERIVGVFRKK